MAISRREFIKFSLCSLAAMQVYRPRLSFSQVFGNNRNINLVLMNLEGGMDGLAISPLSVPALAAQMAINRPNINVDPALALDLGGFRVLHPNFTALINQLGPGKVKIVSGTGYPNPTGSHNDDANIFSMGDRNMPANSRSGWIARLSNQLQAQSYDVWGLSSDRLDFRGANVRPILAANGLSSYALNSRSNLGGSNETRHSDETIQAILSSESTASEAEARAKQGLGNMYSSVSRVGQISALTTIGTYNGSLGSKFKSAAQVIKDKVNSNGTNSLIFYLTQGGYDTHSDQNLSLPNTLSNLAANMSAFFSDILALGQSVFDNTVVVCFSEFGRTIHENGGLGTDHAQASVTLLFGGLLNAASASVVGVEPSLASLTAGDNLPLGVDYRNVISEMIVKLGGDPQSILNPNYGQVPLALFT